MSHASESAFDPARTYAFLNDGGAATRVEAGERFWQELMSGAPRSADARLVAEGDGWLLSAYDMTASMTTWERHPAGEGQEPAPPPGRAAPPTRSRAPVSS